MERSRNIFLKISSASRNVITTANKYADHKGLLYIQRSHFQLESDMRRISAACDTLAGILGRSDLPDEPAIDVRLQDWLSGDEPRMCLDTLSTMEKLLQMDMPSWKNMFMGGFGTTPTQDRIKEAVDLLGSCKDCFHFLFTPETWNNEWYVRQQKDVSQSREHVQEGSHIFAQTSPVSVLTSIDTTVSDTDVRQHKRAVTQGERERIDDMQQKKEENARNLEEILKWLDGLNCVEKQDVTLLLRQPDTCKWLFDTTKYKLWRDDRSPCLWLCGKPGAGKSVLVSSVIDSLEMIPREGEILAFFYCDFRNERSTSASEVLRSILSQLLHQLHKSDVDPGNLIHDLIHAKKKGGATRNNAKELAGFVSRTARLFIKKPLVVVDALDECRDVETLLGGLNALKGCIQLFLTSRPLQVIKDMFSGVPLVSMDDMAEELAADIALHVTRELDARRRLRVLRPETRTEIRSVLCDKANGMFRWVQCSIDTLNRCVTLKEIQAALNNLPEGLDETYERILLAIDIKTREGQLALRALVWLVAALRPLHTDELMEGLSIDVEKRTLDPSMGPMHREALLDACGSLVTYIEDANIIILSHFSVMEYLISEFTRTKLPQYYINWENAHLQLARSCMYYISICLRHSQGTGGSSNCDVSSSNGISSNSDVSSELNGSPRGSHPVSRPLLDYVLEDALEHFQYFGSQIGSVLHDLKVLEQDIEQCSWVWDAEYFTGSRVARFGGYRHITRRWPRHTHDLTLYILIAFAPDSLLRAYLPRPALKPKKGTNPLIYAAYFDKHEQAQTLLSRGAKLNCRGWELDGSLLVLPIEVALHQDHYSMVAFFVAEGSPVSLHIFTRLFSWPYGIIPHSTTRVLLQTDDFAEAVNDPQNDLIRLFFSYDDMGSIRGEDFIDLLRRMIQVVPEHNSIQQYLDSILHTAMEDFHEVKVLEIVKLLVGHGYDLLEANSSGKTLIYIAIEHGHVSVGQYLISLGVQLSPDILVTLDPWSNWKTVEMIHFLVENGADVHACTATGDTVFHVALIHFDEDEVLKIAKLLVASCGYDPLKPNSSGKSSFRITIEMGYIFVVRYLLSLGVLLPPDILVTLDPWCNWKTAKMVCLLVENGADVHACTATGDSVFHIGLESYNENEALKIAKLLVGYGCNPLGANSSGRTSLHIAIKWAHISVVQYLLSLGIPLPPDILVTSPVGPWITAEMVHFLVENGADVHACTETGDTVFHIALEVFDDDKASEIAEFLVPSYGFDPLRANSSGKTSLRVAIEQGHISVARYLLSLGVRLPPDMLVTLDLQGIRRKAQVVRFLVENGANVHARNARGDSVLHVVLESLRISGELNFVDPGVKTMEFLVAHGCDPFEANSRGKTPLGIAVEHGLFERYLRSLVACDLDEVRYVPHVLDAGPSIADQE